MTKPVLLVGGLVGAVLLAGGLWAFQPWRLFTSSTVDEQRPTSVTAVDETSAPSPSPTRSGPPAGPPTGPPTGPPSAPPAGLPSGPIAVPDLHKPRDRVLAAGAFEDAEHETSGRAEVLRLADGRRFVRLEDLAGSDGPDLHVWLSEAPSGGDWGSYDDGRYVRLGELEATHGNQNYEIPADADLSGLRSVVIWCDRFNVAFGTAPLVSPTGG